MSKKNKPPRFTDHNSHPPVVAGVEIKDGDRITIEGVPDEHIAKLSTYDGHAPTDGQFIGALVSSAPVSRYSVVSDVNFDVFCARVEKALGDGWKLQGGVYVGEYHDPASGLRRPGWHQALTLER